MSNNNTRYTISRDRMADLRVCNQEKTITVTFSLFLLILLFEKFYRAVQIGTHNQ